MSDTTYSDYDAGEGDAPLQPRARTRPRSRPLPQQEPEYEEYEVDVEDPTGLFSTPARTITVVFSMLLLLAVGVAIAWQLGSTSVPNNGGNGTVAVSIGPRTGMLAPNFSLLDVKTNKAVSLESLRGQPVWINFWGTWCPPCKAEMPEMEKLYQQYKGQVKIIGISMGPRDDVPNVKQFVDLNGYHWDFIHDADSSVMNTYQVTGIPSSFFIDKNGIIRAVEVGGAMAPQLEANLKQALNAQ
jgi:peroxiredoxin